MFTVCQQENQHAWLTVVVTKQVNEILRPASTFLFYIHQKYPLNKSYIFFKHFLSFVIFKTLNYDTMPFPLETFTYPQRYGHR